MVEKIKLASGVTEIRTFFKDNQFRAFVVETSQGNILIDTCMEDDKEFLKVILGMNISMIVLTHHHRDHTGALPGILEEMPSITIAAHRQEAAKMSVRITQLLDDQDLISGELRVIHVPGHTAGNIALYHERDRFMIAGDTVFGAGGFQGVLISPPEVYSDDAELARQSIRKLLDYPFRELFFSHGDHLRENAYEQIRELIQDLL